MDVHSLRVFAKVAELLSVTQAGEQLGLSQSAVSHQIAKLERETQVQLLERTGRRIKPTLAGEALCRHALEVIARCDGLPALVRAVGDPTRGVLRIGASVTACQYLVPDPLRELRACFPRLSISVVPGDSPQIGQWLADGQIDIGIIVRGNERTPGIQTRPLFRDRLGLVMPPAHPLVARPKLTPADLKDQTWVLYNRTSTTSTKIQRHLSKLGVNPANAIELGAFEAIKELIKLGLGLGVMSDWTLQDELTDGSLLWRPLPGPRLEREWCIALPSHREASVIEETFAGLCARVSRAPIGRQAVG